LEKAVTGFIRGLFGKSKKDDDAAKEKKDANAYFLDADSSKSFGDIDYMRTAREVRKSFPKGFGETTEVVSSMDKKKAEEQKKAEAEKSEAKEQKIEPKAQFSKSDGVSSASTNMDMFRKMAKDIKKS
jgi:hypothetical protein